MSRLASHCFVYYRIFPVRNRKTQLQIFKPASHISNTLNTRPVTHESVCASILRSEHVTMFKNKIVIVTGASSDVGQAISIKFSREGASVVLVGRNEEKLTKVKKLCDEEGSSAFIIKADITEDDEAENVIEETVKKFNKLDILVNNASILRVGTLVDASILEAFDDVMDTNVRAVVNLTSFATKHLIASKGNIVNVSSIGANRVVAKKYGAYCISHAALNHFTRTAAVELGKEGVRVNSVSPSVIDCNSSVLDTLLEDLVDSEEVADLVLYLASDDANSVTGSNYTCDSGSLAKS